MKTPNEGRRRPTIADRFLNRQWHYDTGEYIHPRAIDQIWRSLRTARRFVLDIPAAQRIAEVVKTIPDLIIREHQFATQPFDVMWIEWPSWHYWMRLRQFDKDADSSELEKEYAALKSQSAMEEHRMKWGRWDDPLTADYATGYLFDHGRVNTFAAGYVNDPYKPVLLTPMQYRLHTEWLHEDQLEFMRRTGMTQGGVDMFCWGSSYSDVPEDKEDVLRRLNVCEFVPYTQKHQPGAMKDRAMADAARGAVGDIRTIVTLLLILNRPDLVTYVREMPHMKGFSRGKLTNYWSHTTITFPIDPVPTLKKIGTAEGTGVTVKRHERRGHYAQNKQARDYAKIAGCIHEWCPCTIVPATQDHPRLWVPIADPPEDAGPENGFFNWVCKACDGHRWWIDEYEAGDATKGFVAHYGYNVTARTRYRGRKTVPPEMDE